MDVKLKPSVKRRLLRQVQPLIAEAASNQAKSQKIGDFHSLSESTSAIKNVKKIQRELT